MIRPSVLIPTLRHTLRTPRSTYKPSFVIPTFSRLYTMTIPEKMRCVLIRDGKGPAENLYLGEEPVPTLENGQVLIKVKNFGLNRMDISQRLGQYPLPPQASKTILGVEFSGTIVKLEGENGGWKAGDQVAGLAYGGAYAEYVAVSSKMIFHKPTNLSFVEAAGIPENWLTAFQALFVEGGFKKGYNVLIHAGASGVGVAANQLAINAGAANVFTTAGSDEKVKFLEELGKGKLKAINYKTQDFEEEVKKVVDGVDLIVDFVGPSYWNQNISLLKQDGTIIFLAGLSGAKLPAGASYLPILFKRLNLRGSTLRSRSADYQGVLLRRFEEEALPALAAGGMEVKVHEVFDWSKVVEAHKEMEANKNSGKIVFEIPEQ